MLETRGLLRQMNAKGTLQADTKRIIKNIMCNNKASVNEA